MEHHVHSAFKTWKKNSLQIYFSPPSPKFLLLRFSLATILEFGCRVHCSHVISVFKSLGSELADIDAQLRKVYNKFYVLEMWFLFSCVPLWLFSWRFAGTLMMNDLSDTLGDCTICFYFYTWKKKNCKDLILQPWEC